MTRYGFGRSNQISLALIKLGIGGPDAVSDLAFVENCSLVPKTPH